MGKFWIELKTCEPSEVFLKLQEKILESNYINFFIAENSQYIKSLDETTQDLIW